MTRTWIAFGSLALGIAAVVAWRGCGADDEPGSDATHASSAPVVEKPARRAGRRRDGRGEETTSPSAPERDPRDDAAPTVATGRDPPKADDAAGREAKLRAEISRTVFHAMEQVIADALRDGPAFNPGTAPDAPTTPRPGTLAAAKSWSARELPSALWAKVRTELRATDAELDKCWKSRDKPETRRACYGNGSFLVSRRAKTGAETRRTIVGRPMTDEEWWARTDSGERLAWLAANFAESSGYFEVVGTPQESCPSCDGAGSSPDGVACRRCNGCGVVRSVDYR